MTMVWIKRNDPPHPVDKGVPDRSVFRQTGDDPGAADGKNKEPAVGRFGSGKEIRGGRRQLKEVGGTVSPQGYRLVGD